MQLARELCSILHGWQRDVGAAHVSMAASDLSRLRHGDLRRFSLARIMRYIARAGYDIEVHLKKTPRLEQHPKLPRPTSTVVRYNYYGQLEQDAWAVRSGPDAKDVQIRADIDGD